VKRETFSRVEQALRAADLLLQAGGFGLVVMDLGDIPPQIARRVPLASWFRFRRTVENTATALVVVEQEASAKSCASLVLKTQQSAVSNQQSAVSKNGRSHACAVAAWNAIAGRGSNFTNVATQTSSFSHNFIRIASFMGWLDAEC